MPEKFFETESLLVRAVAEFDQVAKECGVTFLLVGAYARDLFLRDGGSTRLPRRTNDVDFAVMVASWDEFLALRTSLLQKSRFVPVSAAGCEVLHKLMYCGQLEFDFIPFGGLAPEGHSATGPRNHPSRANRLGSIGKQLRQKCPPAPPSRTRQEWWLGPAIVAMTHEYRR